MNHTRKLERHLVDAVAGRYYGKYRARVHNNVDPENRGRLQVVVENIMNEVPIWALPCVPYAGPGVGMFFLPEEEAHVWVEFEGGHMGHPIWTGCFWKEGELAPGSVANRRFLKTKEFTIEIDDDAGTLTLSANAGGAKLTMTRNQIQLEAAGDITSTVGARKTTLNIKKFDVHDGALEIT